MTLEVEYLPASGTAQQHIVLLHGWGGDREIWRPVLRHLRRWANVTLVDIPGCSSRFVSLALPSLEELLLLILEVAPPQAVFVGHSLGGKLALELGQRYPERVLAIAGICSNPQFIECGDWPGMPRATFDEFQRLVRADVGAALNRFAGLQALGSANQRGRVRALRKDHAPVTAPQLLCGLDWLAQLDQRPYLASLAVPQVYFFAQGDALVPVATAVRIEQELAQCDAAAAHVFAGSGHLLPWEQSTLVADSLRQFLSAQGLLSVVPQLAEAVAEAVPKAEVAASFSRCAATYDSVAGLQREVGEALLSRLVSEPAGAGRVLDLGCGTGHFTHPLEAHFPQAECVGLDIATGMVAYARASSSSAWRWVVGDAEDLPLASASVDLIFSSLAVQWCARPASLFAELRRILKPGGKCVFTTLGPQTLKELRAAWAAVDAHQHVNEFAPLQQLEVAATAFSDLTLTLEVDTHTMRYDKVRELLNELKSLGAHNMNRNRQPGLTGRKSLQGMLKAYELFRENGKLPATYEVIYGELTRHD